VVGEEIHGGEEEEEITAENQRAFDERTRMIEEHLARLLRRAEAKKKVSDT